MNVGDIVRVHDFSQSLAIKGDGSLETIYGTGLTRIERKVVAVGCVLPSHDSDVSTEPPPPNNVILCEVKNPAHIMFTKEEFCTVIQRHYTPPTPLSITVPRGTPRVTITFEGQ